MNKIIELMCIMVATSRRHLLIIVNPINCFLLTPISNDKIAQDNVYTRKKLG